MMPRVIQQRSRMVRLMPLGPRVNISFVLTACALALPATTAHSQSSPEYVSRDLIAAFLLVGGMGGSNIRVGAVPDDLLPGIITPELTVLGSATTVFGNITIATSTRSVEQTQDSITARLRSLGFVPPPSGATSVEPGFTSARVSPLTASAWCRNQDAVAVLVEKRETGGSRLSISQVRGAGLQLCNRPPAPPPRAPQPGDTPRPLLPAPPNSSFTGGGSSSGGSSSGSRYFSMTTEVKSSLSLPEILRHYADKVKESAWMPKDSAISPSAGVYTFTIIDAGGIAWSGELMVSLFPGPGTTMYDVRFNGRTR